MRDASLNQSAVVALSTTSGTAVVAGDSHEFGTLDTRSRLATYGGLGGNRTGAGQASLLAVFMNPVATAFTSGSISTPSMAMSG